MKLFSALAAAALTGAALTTILPAVAGAKDVPNTPSIDFLAGNFAGGYCLYKTGIYEEDAIFARTTDAGLAMGMTPEEVVKMADSPAFMPLVMRLISQEGGCVELSNRQLKAWDMPQRVKQIIR